MQTQTIAIILSEESVRLLDKIAECGVFGYSRETVAERFIDEQIQGYVDLPKFNLSTDKPNKEVE